jgi:hypothetical protein
METSKVKITGFSLWIILLFTACKAENKEYALTDKEIKTLLMDIHISEAALQSVFGRRKDSLREVYMSNIYKIHRTDSVFVQRLLIKLREDPEKIEVIYQQMLDEMSAIPD